MYLRISIGTVETSGAGAAGALSSPSNPSAGVLAWVGEISLAVALCSNNQVIASVRSQVIEGISPITAARTTG